MLIIFIIFHLFYIVKLDFSPANRTHRFCTLISFWSEFSIQKTHFIAQLFIVWIDIIVEKHTCSIAIELKNCTFNFALHFFCIHEGGFTTKIFMKRESFWCGFQKKIRRNVLISINWKKYVWEMVLAEIHVPNKHNRFEGIVQNMVLDIYLIF